MTKPKVGRPSKRARIYYGRDEEGEPLFWTVKVRDGKRKVNMNGSLADAMAGAAGTTIGCHLSVCCQRNAAEFEKQAGHACKMASFTSNTALIVTKIKNGQPVEAVRYAHSYGQLVALNDTDPKKNYLKKTPDLVEREFTLKPPQKRAVPGAHNSKNVSAERAGSKRQMVPRGALKRAVDAGLVNPGLMAAIR
jgi:hypothetical protein